MTPANDKPYVLDWPHVESLSAIRRWAGMDRERPVEDSRTMTQVAPHPVLLEKLVSQLEYRPGWRFSLVHLDRGQGSVGLTLRITAYVIDTYHTNESMRINHYMIVPAASYDERSWRRWLFEQILLVERHESAEFFKISDERPYAPNHGPGNDPYIVFEEGTRQEKRTSYLGVKRSGDDPETEGCDEVA